MVYSEKKINSSMGFDNQPHVKAIDYAKKKGIFNHTEKYKCDACNIKCSKIHKIIIPTKDKKYELCMGTKCSATFLKKFGKPKNSNLLDTNEQQEPKGGYYRNECCNEECNNHRLNSRTQFIYHGYEFKDKWTIDVLLCDKCDLKNELYNKLYCLIINVNKYLTNNKQNNQTIRKLSDINHPVVKRTCIRNIYNNWADQHLDPSFLKLINSLICNNSNPSYKKYKKTNDVFIAQFFIYCLLITSKGNSLVYYLPKTITNYIVYELDKNYIYSNLGCIILDEDDE